MESNVKKPEVLLEMALERVRKTKNLDGEFIVNKQYEQGPLPIQKCTVLTIYYRDKGSVKRLYRWRSCSINGNTEDSNNESVIEAIAGLILDWNEIWNLINTKPK